MYFLVEWSKRRGKSLPKRLVEEGLDQISGYLNGSGVILGRHINGKNSNWRGKTFPLLKKVSKVGKVSPYLTKQINAVIATV